MSWLDYLLGDVSDVWLITSIFYGLGCLGVLVAVFGKAWGRFPFHPDELRRGNRHPLPRSRLYCFKYFDAHKLELTPARKVKHENIDSQRTRGDGGG